MVSTVDCHQGRPDRPMLYLRLDQGAVPNYTLSLQYSIQWNRENNLNYDWKKNIFVESKPCISKSNIDTRLQDAHIIYAK